MKRTVLVAEDDSDILNLLKMYLESSGFRVVPVKDGKSAWQKIRTEEIDLAVLDVMMPEMDGFTLIQKIRSEYNLPVLLLTARTGDADKILGLNLGADDYMTKPFNPLEVVARVNANLRRFYQLNPASSEAASSSSIRLGALELDTEKWILRKNGSEIILTPNEYKLLAFLMQSPGRVYTKSQLCIAINGEYYDNYENAIMVHICSVRN